MAHGDIAECCCASRNAKANAVAVQRFRFAKDNTGRADRLTNPAPLTSALQNQQAVACKLSHRTKNKSFGKKYSSVYRRKEGNEQNVLPEI